MVKKKKDAEKEYEVKVLIDFSTIVGVSTMHPHAVLDLEKKDLVNILKGQIEVSGGIDSWLESCIDNVSRVK